MAGRKPPSQHGQSKEIKFNASIYKIDGWIYMMVAEPLYGKSAKNIFRNQTETASAIISSMILGMERNTSRCCIKRIDWYIWYWSTISMLGFVYISNPWIAIFG